MQEDKFKIGGFFAKVFLLFTFIALIFIFVSIAKETYKKNQIQKEILALQEEAQKISRDNSQIKEKIAYLESPEYQTKEAKDKLGLRNPDEHVIVVKPNTEKETQENLLYFENIEPVVQVKESPNYLKWWNYFFKY